MANNPKPNPQNRSVSDSRPALHPSRSFTRMPPSPAPESPRKRASTMQDSGIPAIPEARYIDTSPELPGRKKKVDVFEQDDEEESEEGEEGEEGREQPAPVPSNIPELNLPLPSTFDELPIEIQSLTERFLDSLNAKVHPQPLTADALSDLFQDFYERAASHIDTHISSLASRIGRDTSPSLSDTKPKPPPSGGGRARPGANPRQGGRDSPSSPGGEMLTATEVASRKKARRLLELRRPALEEAVERRVCERVYPRIFAHKSTDDEARDAKLRSRTAALAVVGVGLKELHMNAAAGQEAAIHAALGAARDALHRMDGERCPAGKLQHLTAAHQSIVETLSAVFPTGSSADEVLPTLIYTLITGPPAGVNAVSNLNFIQRFRNQAKMDGEAAYCLVNLEAAISFLETVDLSSLKADEMPAGPGKGGSGSRPATPSSEATASTPTPPQPQPQPANPSPPGLSPAPAATPGLPAPSPSPSSSAASSAVEPASKSLSASTTHPTTSSSSSSSRPALHTRRLSHLVQVQADRLEAGRQGLLSSADKVYDSINGTLDSSLQFVFGRFRERTAGTTAARAPGAGRGVGVNGGGEAMPKTLEEARRLVSRPSLEERGREALGEGVGDGSGRSSPSVGGGDVDDPLAASAGVAAPAGLLATGPRANGEGGGGDTTGSSAQNGGNNKMLDLIAGSGRGGAGAATKWHSVSSSSLRDRDRSADSARGSSVGSSGPDRGKRVAFTEAAARERERERAREDPLQRRRQQQQQQGTTANGSGSGSGSASANMAAQGATLFNAINPLSRFQVPGFARFGPVGGGGASGTPSAATSSAGRATTAASSRGATNMPAQSQVDPRGSRGAQSFSASTVTGKETGTGTPSALASGDGRGTRPRRSPPREAAADAEPPSPSPSPSPSASPSRSSAPPAAASDADADEALNAREALAGLRRLDPPRQRFLEVRSAGELRVGEVEELLGEFRRLARGIGEALV